MSGRGLGHTGGTLDKLESIPGYRLELTTDEFIAQVREIGLAIIGQSANLVPADKKLYALRDVTATVDNVSLIAASIMSKKLAGGADAIVLDVKVGDGAFMKTIEDARALAETMIELGERAGRKVVCVLTDMDQPLGRAVGNALEIREAIDTIRGEGPADFQELVLASVAHLLALSDLGIDEFEGRKRAEDAVADGSALAAYERWIRAQGGDPDPDALPAAPSSDEVAAPAAGFVRRLGAIQIGHAALHLGAGRRTKEDSIDYSGRGRLPRQARRRGRRGRRARRDTRTRRGVRGRGGGRGARRLRARRRASAAPRRDRPRHPCLSSPRSRPSAAASPRGSRAGASPRLASTTRA